MDYKKADEVITPIMAEIIKSYNKVHGEGAAERELNGGKNAYDEQKQ